MFLIHDKAQCYITTKIIETEKKKQKITLNSITYKFNSKAWRSFCLNAIHT